MHASCGEYDRNLFFCLQGDAMKAAELVMLQSWRKPAKLFSDFNLQFAGVMGILLVILLVLIGDTRPHHARSFPVDMPKVLHPVPMRDADRDDAMLVVITREGQVYFRNEQINVVILPVKIEDHLKDPGVERKVYIFADARARWGLVKLVIDAVRTAGVMHVALMTDQRRSAALNM
jgi:biopolymer transport protein ExbD/biopolymer transport protein TolR